MKHKQLENRRVLVILPRWGKTFIGNNIGRVMETLEKQARKFALYCEPSCDDSHFKQSFPNGTLYNYRTSKSILRNYLMFTKVLIQFKPDMILWNISTKDLLLFREGGKWDT